MSISALIGGILDFYSWILVAYIIMSWVPVGTGFIEDLRRVLAQLSEPYLSIFRRVIPPVGMIDISPIAGFLVLSVIRRVVMSALAQSGL